MDQNPYAPPQSTPNSPLADAESQSATPFFAVSVNKLVVMSFCTLGLYQYYWFYMNWRTVRERTGEDISPVWRTVFSLFFCYQFFNKVKTHSPELPSAHLQAGALAFAWIVPTLMWRLPDPFWLILYLAIFALAPVQSAINTINTAACPTHDPNAKFSAWNWVAVAVGIPLFSLGIIGTFLPQ